MVDISTEKPIWTEGIQFKVYVIAVSSLIITITKLSNVTGYQLP